MQRPDGRFAAAAASLVESLHDLPDAGQVGAAQREVAAGGPHLVAHFALLADHAVALGPRRHAVLARVQQAPVVPVCGWSTRLQIDQRLTFESRFFFLNAPQQI